MGGNRSGGKLTRLGLKRPKRRIWVSTFNKRKKRFNGYYKYRALSENGHSVGHWCEDKAGTSWFEPERQPTLEDMGLKRLPNGRIVRKDYDNKT